MQKAVPTVQQLTWADCELGAIFHYDITVFEQKYKFRKQWGYSPDPAVFDPTELDTDQWIEAAVKAGVKYAVLVAKHCTGFALFPSKANDYHVGNSPCRTDIVKSFVQSCKKYGIRPGIYYSAVCNAYENVDNPGRVRTNKLADQAHYNDVLKTQLTELWSNYGEWFEIWFDGGTLSPEEGGLDIAPLLKELQPNAITFQGDKLKKVNNLRWVGNEEGVAPKDCYCTTDELSQADGTETDLTDGKGSKFGSEWKPAECDMPLRKRNEWFYKDGQDYLVMRVKPLFQKYLKTVGRNTNLLLGIVVDRRGRVPDADVRALEKLGEKIKASFAAPLASAKGRANYLTLTFPEFTKINTAVLCEDLTNGHTVFAYKLEAHTKNGWKTVFDAEVIGHKRIAQFRTVSANQLRLIVTDGEKSAALQKFEAFRLK